MILAALLPKESFVPFECRKLEGARVLFQNPELSSSGDILEEYAFAVWSEGEAQALGSESRLFLGERYGGEGVMHNGGGVRCGLSGEYQVKGIGKNPLAADASGFWYTHGGGSLTEALLELIWGEVLHRALPHGAVRSLAIVSTGTECWTRGADLESRVSTARALIVREAALRPAHFERAYHYRPTDEVRLNYPHDTERTRKAIQVLPDCLPRSRGVASSAWFELSALKKLEFGVEELALRLAEQHATARARRIMHGALCSANVCLDGRWIDYGTISALSCYANAVLGGNAPFWQDHQHLEQVLRNLCFYVGKYYSNSESVSPLAERAVLQVFQRRLSSAMIEAFVLLTGYPAARLAKHAGAAEVVNLGIHLIQLAQDGNARPFNGIPDETIERGYDLPQILLKLAACGHAENIDQHLASLIQCSRTRQQTIRFYQVFADRMTRDVPRDLRATKLRRRVVFGAAKLGRQLRLLYKNHLSDALSSLQRRHRADAELSVMFGRFFRRLMAEVEVLYRQDSEHRALVLRTEDGDLHLDFAEDSWVVTAHGRAQQRFPFAVAYDEHTMPPIIYQARAWWGAEVWEALQ